MKKLLFVVVAAFAACDGESPSPSTEKASDRVCLEDAKCGNVDDPEAFCEAIRARRFNDDGSLTDEGRRALETCAAEFEAQSVCLLDHAVCEGGSYSASACAGPCEAECTALSQCG